MDIRPIRRVVTGHDAQGRDVVVQNGTNHAWANRGHTPCLMAFVLIDAPGDPPAGKRRE